MNAHAPATQPTDPELRDTFINGMSHAACTVNIITTDGPAGKGGVTVSAMSSVSADTPKPTLLVCVHHLSPVAEQIKVNGCFVVNVLRDDQAYISDTFAGRFKDQVTDKFDCTEWTNMSSGAPRVVDPLVGFDCKVVSAEQVGTHYVFFGEVQDIFISGRGSPLIYANRAYGSANRIEPVNSIGDGRQEADRKLSIGCFHSFGPFVVPEIIHGLTKADANLSISVVEGDQRRLQEALLSGECEVGLMYEDEMPEEIGYDIMARLELYVLLAENDPLTKNESIGPEDLADRPLIYLQGLPTDAFLADVQATCGRDPKIAYRPRSLEMARSMVGHGLGYTVLATKPASAMTYDGKALTSRTYAGNNGSMNIVLAVLKDADLSPAAQQFHKFCRTFFDLD